MNNCHNEYMAEYHHRDLLKQSEQIKLANLAAKSRVYRPNLFTRAMFNFANWMITTGKQLRKRYEIPTVKCNNSPKGSFAR